jgi:phospholipid/cholesterol/gamma-HCH transport system substrate-binding protein
MKKIPREVKIGITALLSIILFIWLYSFLKGENLLTRTAIYYVIYDEVSGLKESDPIEVNGYKVGVVQSVRFIDDGTGRLLATLSINERMRIPKESIAEITTATLIAGMKIQFIFSDNRESYQRGDTIKGKVAESLTIILERELLPVKDKVNEVLDQLDSTLSALNETLSPDFITELGKSVQNLSSISSRVDETLKIRENEISQTISNLHEFSNMMAVTAPKIESAINGLNNITDSIAAADLTLAINNLTMTTAEASELLENLNKGEGSAGKLFTDDSLYINLSASLEQLHHLLEDLRENPKRYVHFSIFGKKNN